MQQEVSKEQWEEWVRDPVTRAFFEAIKEERNAVREAIPRSDPNNQSEMIGRIMRLSALEDILDIDFSEEE